jgi:hypothetical protein
MEEAHRRTFTQPKSVHPQQSTIEAGFGRDNAFDGGSTANWPAYLIVAILIGLLIAGLSTALIMSNKNSGRCALKIDTQGRDANILDGT